MRTNVLSPTAPFLCDQPHGLKSGCTVLHCMGLVTWLGWLSYLWVFLWSSLVHKVTQDVFRKQKNKTKQQM